MTDSKNKFQEEARFRVIRILEKNPEMSQRELAAAVGISTGSVHYVIKALIDKGLLKLCNFTAAEDKRRYSYVLTPKGIAVRAAMTKKFLARKIRDYEALTAEIEALSGEFNVPDAIANFQNEIFSLNGS